MSFAILAEPSSMPTSRSPSPTGRVSPFRGRGFNPIGSRHASPIPSPPPQDSPSHSKIPRLSRRGSAAAFGEKITDYQSSPNRRKLHSQLSQSLTNIAPKRVSTRPPPSPRRPPGYSKTAFQRLSPIVGSSPEPSQSQSSPKLFPNVSSQPRKSRSFVNRTSKSKPTSKATSREPSPSKNPTSPTRIPVKNYKNVQAKVNSFSRPKPKVPPKPQVLSETESDSVTNRKKVDRKESVSRLRTNSRINLNSNNNNNTAKNNLNNKSNKNIVSKDTNGNQKNNNSNTNTNNSNKNKSADASKDTKTTNGNNKSNNKNEETKKNESKEEMKKSESLVKLSDLLQPSTTAVVSSTTTTVTQPLKIEAKIEETIKSGDKTISPMVDGRILSATSVSHAMNKMNDTVLDSQTLMKESGLTKLSPAASTIIAMSNEVSKNPNPVMDTKTATSALPKVEESATKTVEGINSNHVTSTGIIPAKVLEQHVQNNMSKLISPDHKIGNSVQKTANDRIIEARTVVAHDVKPIKITVKERPMDVEVQSGNIRFDTSNGLGERPG